MEIPIRTRDRARELRKRLTKSELWMWLRIRGDPEARFRKQHPIGPYILDFYCPAAKLGVELDGGVHGDDEQQLHDAVRNLWLETQGITVMRIAVKAFLADPDSVARRILDLAREAVRKS